MTEAQLDDQMLVPAHWYVGLQSYQTVRGAGLMGCSYWDRPVVLRGALHCRMAKRGGARQYGTEVLIRYIRRRRLTQVDAADWTEWVCRELAPMASRRSWWSRQRACIEDVLALVSPYRVVIEGQPLTVHNGEAYRNVMRLARAMAQFEKLGR